MAVPGRVVATHINGPSPYPLGPPIELDGLSDADRARAERFNAARQDGLGYLHLQSTRPQTLAYSLTDSPIGQLAWIAEKFKEWTDPAAELPEHAVDRDQLLTNVSLYWFTGSGASSANIVYEGMRAYREIAAGQSGDDQAGWPSVPAPPQGIAVFAADLTIRALTDPADTVEHWSEFDRGGHFPAMEAPDLLVSDLRDFFRIAR
jgi:hypothetical protein